MSCEQSSPLNPQLQTQVPSDWATPLPEQVVVLLYWHAGPVEPGWVQEAQVELSSAVLTGVPCPSHRGPQWPPAGSQAHRKPASQAHFKELLHCFVLELRVLKYKPQE